MVVKVQLKQDRNNHPTTRSTQHETPSASQTNTLIRIDSISDQRHHTRDCYATLNTRPARVDRLEKSPIIFHAHTLRKP
jgi:hypothetical protein